jgi:hypothetical protein
VSGAELTLLATLGVMSGHTGYGLSLAAYEPSLGDTVEVFSELVYPLSFIVAGAQARLDGPPDGGLRWAIVAEGLTNLGDPDGEFEDSDHLAIPSSNVPKTLFSYTQSAVEAQVYVGDGSLRIVVHESEGPHGPMRLELMAGYRQERYRYDAFGFHGWQLGPRGRRLPRGLSDDVHVLRYTAVRHLPYVGVGAVDDSLGPFRLEREARLLAVITDDFDEHLLRHKEGFSRSIGVGLLVRVAARREYEHALLGIRADLELLHAEGILEQEYLEDDPSLPGDQADQEIPDSNFEVDQFGLTVMFEIGKAF